MINDDYIPEDEDIEDIKRDLRISSKIIEDEEDFKLAEEPDREETDELNFDHQ